MPSESPRSTLMFSAQARSYGLKKADGQSCKPSIATPPKRAVSSPRIFPKLLSKYKTPVRKPIKNPFNERLVEFFNRPICSPDFCASIDNAAQESENNELFWSAEDLWKLNPAQIDSPQADIDDCFDEETESLLQDSIDRYFREIHDITSPIVSPKPNKSSEQELTPYVTPPCFGDRANSTPCTRRKPKRALECTVSTQTTLSFSEDIPDSILELLKPFTNTLDESRSDLSFSNSSFSNLRRKLMFNELCDSMCDSDDDSSDPNKKVTSRFLPGGLTPDRVKLMTELFSKSPDISPIAEGLILSELDNLNDDLKSPSSSHCKGGDLDEAPHQMSVDYMEPVDASLLQPSTSSQSSTDAGYHTLDKSQQSKSSDRFIDIPSKCSMTTPWEKISSPPLRRSKVMVDEYCPVALFDDDSNSDLTYSHPGCIISAPDTSITLMPTFSQACHHKHSTP